MRPFLGSEALARDQRLRLCRGPLLARAWPTRRPAMISAATACIRSTTLSTVQVRARSVADTTRQMLARRSEIIWWPPIAVVGLGQGNDGRRPRDEATDSGGRD